MLSHKHIIINIFVKCHRQSYLSLCHITDNIKLGVGTMASD